MDATLRSVRIVELGHPLLTRCAAEVASCAARPATPLSATMLAAIIDGLLLHCSPTSGGGALTARLTLAGAPIVPLLGVLCGGDCCCHATSLRAWPASRREGARNPRSDGTRARKAGHPAGGRRHGARRSALRAVALLCAPAAAEQVGYGGSGSSWRVSVLRLPPRVDFCARGTRPAPDLTTANPPAPPLPAARLPSSPPLTGMQCGSRRLARPFTDVQFYPTPRRDARRPGNRQCARATTRGAWRGGLLIRAASFVDLLPITVATSADALTPHGCLACLRHIAHAQLAFFGRTFATAAVAARCAAALKVAPSRKSQESL